MTVSRLGEWLFRRPWSAVADTSTGLPRRVFEARIRLILPGLTALYAPAPAIAQGILIITLELWVNQALPPGRASGV